MRSTLGNILAIAGFFSSVSSLIVVVIWWWPHRPSLSLKFSSCSFEDNPDEGTVWTDCNAAWSDYFGTNGPTQWCPLGIALGGCFMIQPQLMEVVGFPRNFLQYGVFLIFQGLFANIGYSGKLGVISGFISIGLGLVCIVVSAFKVKSSRMMSLGSVSREADSEESGSEAEKDVKEHPASTTFSDPTKFGNILVILGGVISVLTAIMGVITLWYHPLNHTIYFSRCGFQDTDAGSWTDCNSIWQGNWSVMTIVPTTCLVIGVVGAAMPYPGLMELIGFPRNFAQYGIFLAFQAIYAGLGYCGKIGVIIGILGLCLSAACFVAAAMGEKSSRMEQLEEGNFVLKKGSGEFNVLE
eukprot:TRINITY_DN9404_c0_g2_i1.p1 TRINITY_DN9404_c0_g2~~TRINITY_DN9404_c0_g2_i1.p1  ORF type:complete len:353 (-),score=57.46 TRINITY_DN9404_c0_g2_i1:81-1139(-)